MKDIAGGRRLELRHEVVGPLVQADGFAFHRLVPSLQHHRVVDGELQVAVELGMEGEIGTQLGRDLPFPSGGERPRATTGVAGCPAGT
jgi:hypothetical protein